MKEFIHTAGNHHKIKKPNALEKTINDMRNTKLYELKELRLKDSPEGNSRFADMWILTVNDISEKQLYYEEMMHLLTGIARVAEYEVILDGEEPTYKLITLIEGQIEEGRLNGFGRTFNFETAVCSYGF